MVGTSVGPKGATGYSQVVALNAFATSRGLAIDAGGSANTWPGWTQVSSSTPKSIDMIFMILGNNGDIARTAVTRGLFKLGLGSASNEFDLIPETQWGYTTTSDSPFPSVVGPIPCAIPSGSRIVAQARCTDTTAGDRTFDLSVYGLVP